MPTSCSCFRDPGGLVFPKWSHVVVCWVCSGFTVSDHSIAHIKELHRRRAWVSESGIPDLPWRS